MTIKGRLLSICPMLKAFSSKKVPKMAVFGAKRGVKLHFWIWFCDPQKARHEPRQNPAGVLAVDYLTNPPNKPTNSRVNNLIREIAHAQKRNPLSDLDEILQDGRHPRHDQASKFW